MSKSYRQERYLIQTLDPLHVGAGGNRLGRVDNSIVREPGTRLPKIPGASLHGAIRAYAAYRYGDRAVAGGGKCTDVAHPVVYTFGSINEAGGDSGHRGKVSIGDGRLLLFPVYSLAGPVWVTAPGVLAEFNIKKAQVADDKVKGAVGDKHLNLGWLMLEKDEGDFTLPIQIPDPIRERAMLVSDKLFSQIVNSNLEVRTSVSINPETGAADPGKLFTYEAIPRAALLWFDAVEDDFKGAFPEDHEKAQELNHKKPLDVVAAGLELAKMLGVGGMGTRGFGRIRLETHWEVDHDQS
jgi:CRISPR-associated protein Cmr4